MIAAPRHIPATPDDLTGWCGPVRFGDSDGSWAYVGRYRDVHRFVANADGYHDGFVGDDYLAPWCFDTRHPEARDHLIRRYALPSWHRDTPGGLTPEQSAAVVLGSVLRVRAGLPALLALLPVWSRAGGGEWTRTTDLYGRASLVVSLGMTAGWTLRCLNRNAISGPEVGEDGKLAADTAALANGLALLATPTGILLPPIEVGGEPVLWSIG